MSPPSSSRWKIGVVVPARNEEATIEACIDSIRAAADHSGCDRSLWIVVVADSCTDATAELARKALGPHGQVITACAQSAGSARRLGAKAAIEHFSHVPTRSVWLANTDADSRVCRDWIEVQLRLADVGVAGVAGIVRLDPDGCPVVQDIHRRSYRIHPDGTHSHIHGANIALRADAYLDVGGWMDRALAEDHCLWGRLRSRGWRVSSPANSVVVTSARLKGRAAGGFADALKARFDALHAAT